MKNKELLKKINNKYGLSQVTTKHDRIIEESKHITQQIIYNQLFCEKVIKCTKLYDNALDMIIGEKLHECFTISIIKNIASNPTHYCNKACLNIVNSGYIDSILDDLKQEIFIKLMELYNDNKITLENGNKLVFGTYFNKKDDEKNCYLLLYRVIENYLYNEKKHTDNSAICLDSYNNDNTSVNNESDYIFFLYQTLQDNTLKNTVTRSEIKSIFRMIKNKYSKHYSNICTVFELRYNGLTYEEIAKKTNLSKNQVRYCIQILRNVFNDMNLSIEKTEKTKKVNNFDFSNYGTTYYINKQIKPTKKDMIKYWKRVEKENTLKNYLSKNIYSDIPLTCGIFDCTQTKQIKEYTDNNYNYTFMFNAKNNSLVTVSDRNVIIHEYKCYNESTKNKLSKELPHYKN